MNPGWRLGIVTGLPAEARIASRRGNNDIRVQCCGASTARAESLARSLVDWGAAGLLSFGTSGGIRPGLPAGTVVIASEIVAPGGDKIPLDREWAERLDVALKPALNAVRAPIAGSDGLVASVPAKAALADSLGAVAVDMESHAVARIGGLAGLPVLALRVVADPAGRRLPSSLLAALASERGPRAQRVLLELCKRPGDLPALAGLAMDYRRALGSLRRVAALGGPCFGLAR